jgi:hypothetical protein
MTIWLEAAYRAHNQFVKEFAMMAMGCTPDALIGIFNPRTK